MKNLAQRSLKSFQYKNYARKHLQIKSHQTFMSLRFRNFVFKANNLRSSASLTINHDHSLD